ncbi:MAG: hypothetical protein WBR10_16520 [Candidatus Acidiferrum sp.]
MQATNQSVAPSEPSRANGHTQLHDLFVLTDEQILEIEPEAQDVTVSGDVAQGDSPAGVSPRSEAASQAEEQAQSAQARMPVLPEPPTWLAETMTDPQRGAEARELWEGAQRAEKEAASYREVFAKPEEARAAAERARVLDDIDRAYFAGDATQRAQLAAMMLREDPSAFREMVFEGLRALEAAGKPIQNKSMADAVGRDAAAAQRGGASPAPTAQVNNREQHRDDSAQQRLDSEHQAQLTAYAAFERAANDELERSVGGAIERTLEQALPAAGRPDGAALKGRMAAAIRQDIEKALQGDRQLGEQVAQILSAKRLDNETRAQVVRLIGERAQQLVPSAAKRALSDWTQTTLASHRSRSPRADTVSARRDIAPATPMPRDLHAAKQKETVRASRTEVREDPKGRVDYRKLSDEQILEL